MLQSSGPSQKTGGETQFFAHMAAWDMDVDGGQQDRKDAANGVARLWARGAQQAGVRQDRGRYRVWLAGSDGVKGRSSRARPAGLRCRRGNYRCTGRVTRRTRSHTLTRSSRSLHPRRAVLSGTRRRPSCTLLRSYGKFRRMTARTLGWRCTPRRDWRCCPHQDLSWCVLR